MTYNHLDSWADGSVGFIALDRPGRLNALSLDLLQELIEVSKEIAASDLRSVVVTGNGRAFSAGVDIEVFAEGPLNDADSSVRYDAARLGGDMADAIEAMPQVTIAALHGHVVGGGVVLAAACDLRVAETDTVFTIPEIDLGIPLAWGGVPRLVNELGPAITRELILTARPFTAAEARSAGFLNAVTEPGRAMEVAVELAEHIAEKARFPVVTVKRQVNEVLAGDTSRDDAMGLITALSDDESRRIREAYLSRFAPDDP